MKSPILPFCLLAILLVTLTGCGGSYSKSWGQWYFIHIDAASGRVVTKLNADNSTFRILESPAYASDKNNVYKFGHILKDVDGSTFKFFPGLNYARDKNHIYFHDDFVVDADVDSFQVLTFPYARDAKHIYCGSLRMNVEKPDDFKVLPSQEGLGIGFCYNTKDLVERFGPEFANYKILYKDFREDPQRMTYRYKIAIPDGGAATDGVWNYSGPKRVSQVKQDIPERK